MEEAVKTSGTPQQYKDDRAGSNLIPHAVIGIVKDNIDPGRSGRIKVYLARASGSDPNDAKNWRTVKYLSPFFGTIAPGYNPLQTGDKDGLGKFVGNPQSYGFWTGPPDIGSQVLCIFVNGLPDDGYYIGCVPYPGLTHMVPAVGAATAVVPNEAEANLYGGADRLPVTEVNYGNPEISDSPEINNEPKPVHSYQAAILAKQGLVRDNIRGVVSTSSMRESPSRVFGISTPGQPVYEGGYSSSTIKQGITQAEISKLQIIGRTGGHTIVMDDGTIDGQDQLLRIRSAAGHMIMMSDNGQCVTIIHANGQSWIELGKEGTIDMFSTNSVNVRTEGDLNLHADKNININAAENINMYGKNIKMEAQRNLTIRTGQNLAMYTLGKSTMKVDGTMSFQSQGDSSFASKANNYVNGSKIYLNSGSGPASSNVPPLTKEAHVETTFSQNKGWMYPAPNPLESVVSRAPTHMPWFAANKGVAK